MTRLFCSLFLMFVSLLASAQDYPKMKVLSASAQREELVPMEKNGKWGYANAKGAFRIKPQFDGAEEFKPAVRNGRDTIRVAKVKYGGFYGILDSDGTYLHVPDFDYVSDFCGGSAVFSRRGVYGIISASGIILLDGQEDMTEFDSHGLAWFRKNGKWGVCDHTGKAVFQNRFANRPETVYGSLTQIEEGGLYGLFSMRTRKVALNISADWIGRDPIDPEFVHYRVNGRLGAVNMDGDVVLPPEYDHITGTGNGLLKFTRNGKYGLVDGTGKVLVPPMMITDQVSEDHDFYQFFDESTGHQVLMASHNGKVMTMKELDKALFEEEGRDRYIQKDSLEPERFPFWLKRHVVKEMGVDAYAEYWKTDNAYHPYMVEDDASVQPAGIPSAEDVYVVTDRNFKVLESQGLGLQEGGSLSEAAVTVEESSVSCASWLTPLMTSVNADRLAEYDAGMGTGISSWQTMSAHFRNLGKALDGDLVAVVDIRVEDILMQRTFVKFTRTGTRRLALTQDGILYDMQGYVNGEGSRCFVTGDMIVLPLSIGPDRQLKTRLYTKAGKLITELGDLYCEVIMESSASGLKMLGRDSYFFCRSEVDMAARKYTKHDMGLDPEKLDISCSGGYAYFHDKATGLLKSFMELDFEAVPVPALRCTEAVWDGQRIVGVSANVWDFMEETKWMFIPRVTRGTATENINGYMITIYPAAADGIAIYSINPDIWTNEGIRYGYIGYDDGFFTQPVFEEARPFLDGTAVVKIGKEWTNISKDDCRRYMNR